MANTKSLELQINIAAKQALTVISSLKDNLKDCAKQAEFFENSSRQTEQTLSAMEKAASKTATSIKLFGGSLGEIKNTQAVLKNGITDLVEKGLKPESAEIQNLMQKYNQLQNASDQMETENEILLGSFGKLKDSIGSIAAVGTAVALDKTLISAGSYAVTCADSFNTARMEFGTLLGNVEAGAAVFDTIIKPFNDFTPFDLETTTQATKVLMSSKVAVQDLTAYLTRMGDLAQGNKNRMLSFVNAFSKASAKGKADMEVLNVYLDQGIPILDELAKNFSCTTEEIVKMASQGKISFNDFNAALTSLTGAGGAYAGGMEKLSRNYASMVEGLHESINSLAAGIGEMFLPGLISIVEWLTKITTAINENPLYKGLLAAAIAALVTVINGKAILALAALVKNITTATTVVKGLAAALSLSNPVFLAVTAAVAALAAGFVYFKSKQKEATDAANEHALALYNQQQQLENTRKAIRQMNNEQLWAERDNYAMLMASESQNRGNLQAQLAQYADLPQTYSVDLNMTAEERQRYTKRDEITAKLEQAEANIKMYEGFIKQIDGQRVTNAQNSRVAAGKATLEERDKAYAKTPEYELELAKAEYEKALSYRTLKIEELNEKGELVKSGLNSYKTEAIIKQAKERLDKATEAVYGKKSAGETGGKKEKTEAPKPAFSREWSARYLSTDEFSKLAAQKAQDIEKLTESFKKAYADTNGTISVEHYEEYIEEKAALDLYYTRQEEELRQKADEAEKQRVLNRHTQQMKNLQDEYQYMQELSREALDTKYAELFDAFKSTMNSLVSGNGFDTSAFQNIDIGALAKETGSYAKNAGMSLLAQTQAGQIALGANPLTMLADTLLQAASQLENLTKVLNPLSTIVEGLMAYSELYLNDALEPIVQDLMDLGEIIGQILQPVIGTLAVALRALSGVIRIVSVPLNLLGNAMEWLYNKVIMPAGNAIVKMINAVINVLNKIPGIDIRPLQELADAKKVRYRDQDGLNGAADAASEWAGKMRSFYQAQIDEIDELLRYQIQSLQKQYELGLISRASYIEQKDAYKAAAEKDKNRIEAEMNATLSKIEANTAAALTAEQAQAAATKVADQTGSASYADKWGSVVPVLGNIAGGVVDTAVSIGNTVKNFAKNLFGFAVGTPEIPFDMPAIVHKGEGIIPKTFNEGIKNGDYALVAPSAAIQQSGSTGNTAVINVNVNVEGSVIKKNDLVQEIYDGLAQLINNGASPLPA